MEPLYPGSSSSRTANLIQSGDSSCCHVPCVSPAGEVYYDGFMADIINPENEEDLQAQVRLNPPGQSEENRVLQ